MEYSTGFSSPKSTSFLKRDYRLLRSKVLKILDSKFPHPSKDLIHHESKTTQIQNALKKLIDQQHTNNPQLGYRAPKILDYDFYSPTSKTTQFQKTDKPTQPVKELDLTIQNLCKYLNAEEIELICEDPIYFLGKELYRTNSELNDFQRWNRQLVWVKEKKEKEDNWKQTSEIMRITFNNSPMAKIGERLSCKTVKSGQVTAYDWKSEAKDSLLRMQARKLRARSNQMQSLVQIRKLEELENSKDKESDWMFKVNDRTAKVLEKKAEALKLVMDERKYVRQGIQRKMDTREKQLEERKSIHNIYCQIDNLFKEKITEKCRERDLRNKIKKAQTTSVNFNRRRLIVVAHPSEKGSEDFNINRSNSLSR